MLLELPLRSEARTARSHTGACAGKWQGARVHGLVGAQTMDFGEALAAVRLRRTARAAWVHTQTRVDKPGQYRRACIGERVGMKLHVAGEVLPREKALGAAVDVTREVGDARRIVAVRVPPQVL